MDIMMVREAAEKWGLTERRVTEIIRSGRIKGVFKIGAAWVMPVGAQKPPDERRLRGKNIAKRKRYAVDTALSVGRRKDKETDGNTKSVEVKYRKHE